MKTGVAPWSLWNHNLIHFNVLCRSVLETFEKFNTFATKDLTKQARLLQS